MRDHHHHSVRRIKLESTTPGHQVYNICWWWRRKRMCKRGVHNQSIISISICNSTSSSSSYSAKHDTYFIEIIGEHDRNANEYSNRVELLWKSRNGIYFEWKLLKLYHDGCCGGPRGWLWHRSVVGWRMGVVNGMKMTWKSWASGYNLVKCFAVRLRFPFILGGGWKRWKRYYIFKMRTIIPFRINSGTLENKGTENKTKRKCIQKQYSYNTMTNVSAETIEFKKTIQKIVISFVILLVDTYGWIWN